MSNLLNLDFCYIVIKFVLYYQNGEIDLNYTIHSAQRRKSNLTLFSPVNNNLAKADSTPIVETLDLFLVMFVELMLLFLVRNLNSLS